jgi:phospholipid-transporting ATPase
MENEGFQDLRNFEVNKLYSKKDFKSNFIQTTKYNLLNFVPKNLLGQFTKLANAYFLMMAFLEMVPAISDSSGIPVLLMPLGFVVVVSMIKDAFEDY